jgi:predicted dehydrogenase/threonine dehydrogenase-like Zn-dependent dehydrogenase
MRERRTAARSLDVRQVAQRPRDGQISVQEVPVPRVAAGSVLVRNRWSLISAGTERNKVELGGKTLAQKARARPDLVTRVVERARVEGVRSTVAVVRERLAALEPIGYSSAGVVLAVGRGVDGMAPGDRVACGGGGWANHAEVVAVPRNLVARVPDSVDLADAAYATVGAIALHGVRRSEATVGELVGVIGLGLVGQLAVRILAAAGCRAIGVDVDPTAVGLARDGGAYAFARDAPGLERAVAAAAGGPGLDAVLVCAAASSSDPLELATRLARDRGRVVVVGDVPIVADRALLYDKELELRLSRSYGPGRYDRDYEQRGRDLPRAYVRWTEQRNMQAFVDLIAAGRLAPGPLTTHRIPIDRADEAYDALLTDAPGGRSFGVLLEYPAAREGDGAGALRRAASGRPHRSSPASPGVGLIGAGSFARSTILPALRRSGAQLVAVASERGLSARDVAARHGFERAASSAEEILADERVHAVVVATRHATHAQLAAEALRCGKAVLVEKPLALDEDELDEVAAAAQESGGLLMVGFNRRFAPLAARLRAALAAAPGGVLTARVNAGPLPLGHWLHDPDDGGGRLIGEGCHFVDFLADLAGAPPVWAHAVASPQPGRPIECSDSLVADLRFANGTVASLVYAGSGDTRLPKERIEAFGGGVAAVLDDFRRLELYRDGRRRVVRQAQDKGHRAQIACFIAAAAGRGTAPSIATYLASSRATLAIAESLRSGAAVAVR